MKRRNPVSNFSLGYNIYLFNAGAVLDGSAPLDLVRGCGAGVDDLLTLRGTYLLFGFVSSFSPSVITAWWETLPEVGWGGGWFSIEMVSIEGPGDRGQGTLLANAVCSSPACSAVTAVVAEWPVFPQ